MYEDAFSSFAKIRDVRWRSNLDAADRWAMRWLADNRQFTDVPADKGLGIVILRTETYNTLADSIISKSFSVTSLSDADTNMSAGIAKLRDVVGFGNAHNVIGSNVSEYLQCLCTNWRWPNLRLMVKIHKPVLGARQISAGTRYWTNPCAIWLARELQPLVNAHSQVA